MARCDRMNRVEINFHGRGTGRLSEQTRVGKEVRRL